MYSFLRCGLWCFAFHVVRNTCKLKRINTGALVLFGEDDAFTATGTQQLLDGLEGSTKLVRGLCFCVISKFTGMVDNLSRHACKIPVQTTTTG